MVAAALGCDVLATDTEAEALAIAARGVGTAANAALIARVEGVVRIAPLDWRACAAALRGGAVDRGDGSADMGHGAALGLLELLGEWDLVLAADVLYVEVSPR